MNTERSLLLAIKGGLSFGIDFFSSSDSSDTKKNFELLKFGGPDHLGE